MNSDRPARTVLSCLSLSPSLAARMELNNLACRAWVRKVHDNACARCREAGGDADIAIDIQSLVGADD